MNYSIKQVHVSTISAGDTVMIDGVMKTVSQQDIKRDPFLGHSLFGYGYNCGTKPVAKVLIHQARPNKE